jgi:class 3 adenylate cyclase/predicted ATPase
MPLTVSRDVVCGACRTANAPDHRFCKHCGQALVAAGGEAAAPDEGERRQLTVMFCDLVGSTALSGRLDPDELRHVVGEYQRVCARVIEENEGHIAQYLGDGILAYFGYPRAHEDDARLAVRAGLGVVDAVHALGAALPHIGGEPLKVRVGIHTGPVVVGLVGAGQRSQEMAIGETPNVAARLQTSAEPGSVLISATTHRLAHAAFVCERLGTRTLRGVAHPIEAFSVLAERPKRTSVMPGAASALPFIGREQELGYLIERWEMVKDGVGQGVVLVGEPGIGKSRLADMMREWLADERPTVLDARGSAYSQSSAFYAAIDLVEHLLELDGNAAETVTPEALEAAADRYGLARGDVVPWLAGLLSVRCDEGYAQPALSPQTRKQRTLDAVHRVFVAASAVRPLCLIVEDLHWIDPSTLELLTLLAEHGAAARIFMLLTARPEFVVPWSPQAHVTHITLNRLTRRQSIAMVERLTGGRALPPEVLTHVIAKTDGIPLFVEELTKAVLESDLLRDKGDHYELVSTLPSLTIPATLQDSLTARLDRLGSAKGVAQVAAVLGREFTYELLHTVAGLADTALRRGVEQLVAAELVHDVHDAPVRTYSFKHALVQDAAYHSLLRSTRQRYHRRTAEVLVERFPAVSATEPELVAHHFTEAGLADSAITYWQRAGQRAVERSANVEAIGHMQKAPELVGTRPDTAERSLAELELQTTLGSVLMAVDGYAAPEVERAYDRARELCEQLGDESKLFSTLRGLWGVHVVRANLRRALELGQQCLTLAQRAPRPIARVWAHYALGMTLFQLGRPAEARPHLQDALAAYDRDKRPTQRALQDPGVACLSYTANVLWHHGYADQARRTSREAIALARTLDHPFTLAYALVLAAVNCQFCHEVDEMETLVEAASALSSEHGITYFVAWAPILHGWTLAARGKIDEGIAEQRRGIDAYVATGAALALPYFLVLLADSHRLGGQTQEGLSVLTEAQALVNRTDERWVEPEIKRLRGELLLDEQLLRQALDAATHQQQTLLALRAALSLGRLHRAQGRADEARVLVGDLYRGFTEGFDTRDLREASAFLEM